jgi:hypothetical protein
VIGHPVDHGGMRVRRLALPTLLVALLCAPLAGAHPLKFHRAKADLRVVRPEIGPPLLTHGKDPRPAPETRASRAAAVGFDIGDAQRTPICAASDNQHVLYARLSGGTNRLGEVRGSLQAAFRRVNAVLNAESVASGGPTADYRVLCDGSGQIAINGFATSGSSFDQVVADARAAGFSAASEDYLIFFDAVRNGNCGVGSYMPDESLSAGNDSNTGGGYALVYRDCWFTEIPMHEMGHTMGAVQYSAPHSTGSGGHCNQENDVMCYSPDGGDRNQTVVQNCSGTPRFDCGFDDYFDSAPEPGEYLSTHWNLGSSLNSFITFGAGDRGVLDLIGGLIGDLLDPGRKTGSNRGVAGKPGEWSLFRIGVTRRARTLTVRLRDASSMTLYVRRRKAPTASKYACRDRAGAQGKAVCRIYGPHQGKWIAGVRNDAAVPGTQYRINAAINPQRR